MIKSQRVRHDFSSKGYNPVLKFAIIFTQIIIIGISACMIYLFITQGWYGIILAPALIMQLMTLMFLKMLK